MNAAERRTCLATMQSKLSRLADLYRREIADFNAIPINQRVTSQRMEEFSKSLVSVLPDPEYADLKTSFCIALLFEYDHHAALRMSRPATAAVRKRLQREMPCDKCTRLRKCTYCEGELFYARGKNREKFLKSIRREISELLSRRLAAWEKELAEIDADAK